MKKISLKVPIWDEKWDFDKRKITSLKVNLSYDSRSFIKCLLGKSYYNLKELDLTFNYSYYSCQLLKNTKAYIKAQSYEFKVWESLLNILDLIEGSHQ